MSWAYAVGIGRRNAGFDRGRGVIRLDRPVISVGNLSTGGTGKTPAVRWAVRQLQAMGRRPAVAMRGYKAKPGQRSDEQIEHEESLPGVPVVAQPDRAAGLAALFASDAGREIDCVVLDDGLQHRKIARDLDIVLIDASAPPYLDALLPLGHLREPPSSLARAGAVVITHADRVSPDELTTLTQWLGRAVSGRPVAITRHAWSTLDIHRWSGAGWSTNQIPLDSLAGQRVVGVCAIGRPEGFFDALGKHAREVVDRLALPDHAHFDQGVVDQIKGSVDNSGPDAICMTQKDWVKAREVLGGTIDCPVLTPGLELGFDSGESGLRACLGAALTPGM